MHAHVQKFMPLVALYVAIAFVGGSFLHNVIPHSHGAEDTCEAIYGYGHCPSGAGESETGLWQFIHQSIAHENKKAIALIEASSIVAILSLFVAFTFAPVAIERTIPDSLDLALIRGRFRYRAFG